MTRDEYINTIKVVIKQYDDGAIMACEVVGKLLMESNHATGNDWYSMEWKAIDDSYDNSSDKAPSWLRKANL